ncbi:MAG: tRNA pseudouridine(38-40) synthase TruA, partial [Hydrogenophaga sp.]|nr:tRNA pseudouridine(38-40) synthase TruA [Hydrogenophaga sp.]
MTRIALGVSYNGRAYEGWQSQLGGQTVQDKLEQALTR